MPLYVYRCPECGRAEEHLLSSWRDKGPGQCAGACPGVPERQVSTFSARFVGPGFYATEYPTAKRIKDAERSGIVQYSPESVHNLKRRGLWNSTGSGLS